MSNKYVQNIRYELMGKYLKKDFVIDKSGVLTIEIMGASFIANSPVIFGEVNKQYVEDELEWYKSESRNINDLCRGNPPKIWKAVSSKSGLINSNYGWCIFSKDNYHQYNNALESLVNNPTSRQAIMIYNRPAMHSDSKIDGMSDFICTTSVQYLYRNGHIHAIVSMRSSDAWAGYRNDYAWQAHVLQKLVRDYNECTGANAEVGNIIWNAGSLHLYQRQFYLVDHFARSGQFSITKKEYESKYGKVGQ